MRWFFIIAALMSLLSSCAAPGTIVHGYSTNYTIGEVKTASPGQNIVVVKDYYYNKTYPRVFLRFLDDFTLTAQVPSKFILNKSLGTYALTIKAEKGKLYEASSKTDIGGVSHYILYLIDSNGYSSYGLLVDNNGNIVKNAIYYRKPIKLDDSTMQLSSLKVEIISGYSLDMACNLSYQYSWVHGMYFDKNVKLYDKLCGNINYELIFGGINEVSFNVTYREFTRNDLAKPAFFQNLVYRTNEKELRFKNIKIDILEVNSQKIVYKVMEDGLKQSEFLDDGNNSSFEQLKY